jgi:His-Xaa-Ser repeat protein HxsA
MKEKLNSLVKKILLGATAALSTTPIQGYAATINKPDLKPVNTELTVSKFNTFSKTPKLVLKKAINAIYASIGHRSHSSHASHASHASHYSGSNYSTPTYTTPPPKVEKKVEPKKNLNNVTSLTSDKQNKMVFEFGSRTLMKGHSGTDVVKLQDMLVRKGYKIKVTGDFNDETEIALKKFQKKHKVDQSGTMDVKTVYYLKKK